MIAFLPAAAISAVLALVPAFDVVAPFSWIFGMGLIGALYVLVSGRDRSAAIAAPVPDEIIPSQVSAAAATDPAASEGAGAVVVPVPAEGS